MKVNPRIQEEQGTKHPKTLPIKYWMKNIGYTRGHKTATLGHSFQEQSRSTEVKIFTKDEH
eukprot:1139460-Pelagomonas_calceolata.AAC.2